MAHHPLFESDPAESPHAAQPHDGKETGLPAGSAGSESDLQELAAKFTLHGGGRLSPDLSADLALQIVLNEIVEQACLTTGATAAAIVLERAGEWVCRASSGENAPQLGARFDTESGLSGACVKTRRVQRSDDALTDPRADNEACRQLGIRSVIILPLLLEDALAGVFEVFSARPSAFSERDERTLEALSQRVLNNLRRASEPMPELKKSSRKYPTMAEIIVADLTSVSPIAADPVLGAPVLADPFSAGLLAKKVAADEVVGKSLATEKIGVGSGDAVSVVSSSTKQDLKGTERTEQAEDTPRETNLITWLCGVTILSAAVLLALLAGQRLTGRKLVLRAHRRPAPAASLNQSSDNLPFDSGHSNSPIAETRSDRAVPSDTDSSGSSTVTSLPRAEQAPPAGSLLVYENGKEIFRLPPGQSSAVMRASGVEPLPSNREQFLSSGDKAILRRVEPEYPEDARRQGIEGAVVVDVGIDGDGRVLEVKTVSGPPLLAAAVNTAVKQWLFKPRSVNGHPVQMQTRITLNFRLPH